MEEMTLAQRLGRTVHVSSLRMKLQRLWRRSPGSAEFLEDWMVDVANARGARIVSRLGAKPPAELPAAVDLTNEELVIGLLSPQNRDRPQILRLAAQLISRGAVSFEELARLAKRERTEFVLAELARLACEVEPAHPLWSRLQGRFVAQAGEKVSLLHRSRLAQPIMKDNRVNAERWVLVS